MPPSRLPAGLCLSILIASTCAAADGRGFDAATGRDPRRYPPDPQVDYQHLKLEIVCDDPLSKSFVATETLTLATLERPITRVELDAVKLDVRKVTDGDGHNLKYNADGKTVTVEFEKELPPRTKATLKFLYEAHDPEGVGGGIHFALPTEGYEKRPLAVHSQGEPEWNRYWFISHDYPNDKLTSEISIELPAKYVALSNGKLVEKQNAADGRVRWTYRMDQPHSTYLISLVFGEFTIVRDEWRGKPVEYWVPPPRELDAKPTLGRTPQMIEWFSKRTGVDYPYDKYAQALVYEFNWGGMENISCTTLVETAVLDERARRDQDEEGLISHELAHQWFGDLVTCKSWPHLWLNEGAATYMEQVWYEHARGWDDYYYGCWNIMQGVASNPEDDASAGVVFPFYNAPDDIFGRGSSNPYPKGASALHMLHELLGDDIFWKGIHEYLTRFSFKNAETDDLRKVMEELSGRSLEQFFQQWLYRPGSPAITLDYNWDATAKQVKLTATQTQKMTAERPVFELDLPIWLVHGDGKTSKRVLHMDSKTAEMTISADAPPVQVCVDPLSSVLARCTINIPDAFLLEQALHGPTIIARASAIRKLGTKEGDEFIGALETILLNNENHEALRNDAAAALGRMNKDAARDVLIGALDEQRAITNHHVRHTVVDALGGYRGPEVVQTLLRYARKDPCYSIEAAATSALGHQSKSDELIAVLRENLKKPSERDQIRSAAISALAEQSDPAAVDPALEMSQPGQPKYLRGHALGVLGGLGKIEDQKRRICDNLLDMLDEQDERFLPTIIGPLGALGDDKAVPYLQRLADGAASDRIKQAAQGAIGAIHDQAAKQAEAKALQAKVTQLEQKVEALSKQIKSEGNGN